MPAPGSSSPGSSSALFSPRCSTGSHSGQSAMAESTREDSTDPESPSCMCSLGKLYGSGSCNSAEHSSSDDWSPGPGWAWSLRDGDRKRACECSLTLIFFHPARCYRWHACMRCEYLWCSLLALCARDSRNHGIGFSLCPSPHTLRCLTAGTHDRG